MSREHSSNPFVKPGAVTGVKLVNPKRSAEGGGPVVVLDRIEPGVQPDYCVHGKVTCYWCPEWCWLGDKSHDLVAAGDAAPICQQCATRLLPPGSRPTGNIGDHLRSEGPH